MSNNPIIVFEGIEGSGKSLHINNVASHLKKREKSLLKLENQGEVKTLKKLES